MSLFILDSPFSSSFFSSADSPCSANMKHNLKALETGAPISDGIVSPEKTALPWIQTLGTTAELVTDFWAASLAWWACNTATASSTWNEIHPNLIKTLIMILETGTNCAFSRLKGADCRVVHLLCAGKVVHLHQISMDLQVLLHLLFAASWNKMSPSASSTHLWAERLWRLEHVEKLRVVNLKQHTSDLSCKAQVHGLDEGKQALTCTWKENTNSKCAFDERQAGLHVGKASIYPASASVHAEGLQPTWWWSVAPVPGRRQRAVAQDAENSIIRNTGGTVSFLKRSQPYLLHGDLRLSVDMLLGVTHSCGILVLGHPPYRIGCYGRSGGGCPGTHGLGGCSSRVTDKPLHLNCRNDGAAFATQAIRDQRRHVFLKRERCPLVVRTPELAKLRWKLLSDLPTRWLAVMRGSCEEGRMEPNIWGRGPEERMALCMFWKSEANREVYRQKSGFHHHPVHFKYVTYHSRCGRTPWVGQRGLGRSWAICPAAG